MAKKSLLLSETQIKILLRDDTFFNQYVEALRSFREMKRRLESQEWDTDILETLFPEKDGYEIVVGEDGSLSYCRLSLEELRKKMSAQGIDRGDKKLTRKEMVELLRDPPSKVDGMESHEIQIPKIGKS